MLPNNLKNNNNFTLSSKSASAKNYTGCSSSSLLESFNFAYYYCGAGFPFYAGLGFY